MSGNDSSARSIAMTNFPNAPDPNAPPGEKQAPNVALALNKLTRQKTHTPKNGDKYTTRSRKSIKSLKPSSKTPKTQDKKSSSKSFSVKNLTNPRNSPNSPKKKNASPKETTQKTPPRKSSFLSQAFQKKSQPTTEKTDNNFEKIAPKKKSTNVSLHASRFDQSNSKDDGSKLDGVGLDHDFAMAMKNIMGDKGKGSAANDESIDEIMKGLGEGKSRDTGMNQLATPEKSRVSTRNELEALEKSRVTAMNQLPTPEKSRVSIMNQLPTPEKSRVSTMNQLPTPEKSRVSTMNQLGARKSGGTDR